MTPLDDNLLDALRSARPVSADEPATSSAAQTMLNKILEVPAVRRHRSFRRVIAIPAGIAAAAAVAAAVLVGVSGGASRPEVSNGPAARAQPDLRTAILTAMDSTAAAIQYSHETFSMAGEPQIVTDAWDYPALAKPGDQVKHRQFIKQNGAGDQDVEMIYTVPASAKVTVSKGIKSSAIGRLIDVEYSNRTWSDQQHTPIVAMVDDRGPAQIKQQIASGHFKVGGKVMLNGRPSIELSWVPAPGTLSQLWVDATSYQLLKTVFHDATGRPGKMYYGTYVTTYRTLPATTANVADLNPVIPHGFVRTATPPSHPHG